MSLREIAPRFQLNTWSANHPAAVVDAVSGALVLPVAYSAAANAVSTGDDPRRRRLGPRRLDGSEATLEFEHAGSTFRIVYRKPAPALLLAELRAVNLAEWGLRTWLNVLVCGAGAGLGSPEPAQAPQAGADGVVRVEAPGRGLALVPGASPSYVTLHASVADFEADITGNGYYADATALRPGAPPAGGPVVALRFNLEATPVVRFALALGADAEAAAARARAGARRLVALDAAGDTHAEAARSDADEGLAAVAAVMGWNSVLDVANQRWYTAPTRAWVGGKFGGWFTWLDDTFFHAYLAAGQDVVAALRNLEVAMSAVTPEDNLACLLSPRTRWLDRSQSPIGAYVLLSYYLRSGDRAALKRFRPVLARALAWWLRERRDERTGLFAYGTSAYAHGAFAGSALAARDESFMDNSPLFDGVPLDPDSGRLRHVDVGLSSLVALEAEMLARVSALTGDATAAASLTKRAEAIRSAIEEHLWDDDAGAYTNLDATGAHSPRLAPTSFYPLLAGAASRERAERLVSEQLLNEARFWGRFALPTIRRDDPAFADQVYWRGRVWPPTNYLVYLGLRRYGFTDAAHALSERSFAMFAAGWREHGHCFENYNAVTGQGDDGSDSDAFYGWGALMPLMRVDDAVFASPWEGLSVDVQRGPLRIGTLWRGRTVRLEPGSDPGAWRLTLDDTALIGGDGACRLSGIEVGRGRLAFDVDSPAALALHVPGLRAAQVLHAALPDGVSLEQDADGGVLHVSAGRHHVGLSVTADWEPGRDES